MWHCALAQCARCARCARCAEATRIAEWARATRGSGAACLPKTLAAPYGHGKRHRLAEWPIGFLCHSALKHHAHMLQDAVHTSRKPAPGM